MHSGTCLGKVSGLLSNRHSGGEKLHWDINPMTSNVGRSAVNWPVCVIIPKQGDALVVVGRNILALDTGLSILLSLSKLILEGGGVGPLKQTCMWKSIIMRRHYLTSPVSNKSHWLTVIDPSETAPVLLSIVKYDVCITAHTHESLYVHCCYTRWITSSVNRHKWLHHSMYHQ